jgi:hypothetical protein
VHRLRDIGLGAFRRDRERGQKIERAVSGKVSNSFNAALIHETGRVFRGAAMPSAYHPYLDVVIYDNDWQRPIYRD